MDIWLPVAGIVGNPFLLLGLGAAIGILSGVFGIGGGTFLTPILLLIGVPAPVAVATGANQVAATAVSGLFGHWRRGNVDLRLGGLLVAGAVAGTLVGVWLARLLAAGGGADQMVASGYAGLMGLAGVGMLMHGRRGKGRVLALAGRLPWRVDFPAAGCRASVTVPLALGAVAGMMAAVLGAGGGFLMVPALSALLGLPLGVVAGTSLLPVAAVTGGLGLFDALASHTVDGALAGFLIAGGMVGAQLGSRLSARMPPACGRPLLGLMVLGMGAVMLARAV